MNKKISFLVLFSLFFTSCTTIHYQNYKNAYYQDNESSMWVLSQIDSNKINNNHYGSPHTLKIMFADLPIDKNIHILQHCKITLSNVQLIDNEEDSKITLPNALLTYRNQEGIFLWHDYDNLTFPYHDKKLKFDYQSTIDCGLKKPFGHLDFTLIKDYREDVEVVGILHTFMYAS